MRLCILLSGSGTNFQAILDAIQQGVLTSEIVLVVSNRQKAYGLERAKNAHLPTLYFPLKPYTDQNLPREQYDADLAAQIHPYAPDLIVLAGWMHVFTPAFINAFPQKIINLHPALPNACAGANAIQRTFEAYQRGEVRHGGCMMHYVIPEVDAGEVLQQQIVPIYPDDTLETFETRMHATEHQLIVKTIASLEQKQQ